MSKDLDINNTTEKKCDFSSENLIENGFLVDSLFECGEKERAFAIIKKNEPIFTAQDFAVTGDILLKYNYIDEAKYYLQKAGNDAEALHRLGILYAYTTKYKNVDQALDYFNLSIKEGYSFSYVNMADLYLEELSIQDLEKAKQYAKKAIENNWNEGYYTLGKISIIRKDFSLAEKYFKYLKDVGLNDYYIEGMSYLYYIDQAYSGYNPKKAKLLLEDLVKTSDSAQKYRWLADFYMHSAEFKNSSRAIELYKIAAENGDWLSEEILKKM